MILLLDHLDSFTYNVVQGLASVASVPVVVHRACDLGWKEFEALIPSLNGLVLSPGPGRADNPADLGLTAKVLREAPNLLSHLPLLGVCLGMQAMAASAGGMLAPAPTLMHGKTSHIDQTTSHSWLLAACSPQFEVMRYHSWCVQTLPSEYHATAIEPRENVLMAMEHRQFPWAGVQFHPESIGSPQGQRILTTFVARCGVLQPGRESFSTVF